MLTTTGVVKVLDLECSVPCGSIGGWRGHRQRSDHRQSRLHGPRAVSKPTAGRREGRRVCAGLHALLLIGRQSAFCQQRAQHDMQKIVAHAKEDVVPIQQVRPDVPGPLAAILDSHAGEEPSRADARRQQKWLICWSHFVMGATSLAFWRTARRSIPPGQATSEYRVRPPPVGRAETSPSRRWPLPRHDVNSQGLVDWRWMLALAAWGSWYGFGLLGQSPDTARWPTTVRLAGSRTR